MYAQYPNPSNSVTNQPDAFNNSIAFDKSISIVVSLNQYLNNATITTNNTIILCQGDSLFVGGDYQTLEGTYYDSLTSTNNADSVIITEISVDSQFIITNLVSILPGDSILLGGMYQTIEGTYYDTLQTIKDCDSIIITILSFVSISGMHALLDQQIDIYPNPTKQTLIIEGVEGLAEIYDLYGRVVTSTQANIVDISHVTNGIYIIKVTTDEGHGYTRKIIKE